MTQLQSPIALIILDGFGLGDPAAPDNAIARAATPHLTLLQEMYPHTHLACAGEAVGLPPGQMGNSEVGHLNLGAGRVVYQDLTRISKAIADGSFFANPVLTAAMDAARRGGTALHLMGLLSDGGVHSHQEHLYALLALAKRRGLSQVYVHAFLDGRDVPPGRSPAYLTACEEKMRELGIGEIATVCGRYWAMDRDKRWERTAKAYAALTYREGWQAATALAAYQQAQARGETDEFVQPTIIGAADDMWRAIRPGDGVIFFNFRPDRARQLTRAFVEADFAAFPRRRGFFPLHFVCLTQYDETLTVPVAFPAENMRQTLGEVFSRQGLKQLRIAETEKYAHVTFFFSGGEEKPFPGEDRILVPSPKVATYDLQPAMSAPAVTERLLAEIKRDAYDLVVLNYANGDMVGHTGVFDAAVRAVQTLDACVAQVVAAWRRHGGIALITADHGNAEHMRDPATGGPFTAHTANDVPLILVSDRHRGCHLNAGSLADVAPTILALARLPQPPEMTGRNLLANDCNGNTYKNENDGKGEIGE